MAANNTTEQSLTKKFGIWQQPLPDKVSALLTISHSLPIFYF